MSNPTESAYANLKKVVDGLEKGQKLLAANADANKNKENHVVRSIETGGELQSIPALETMQQFGLAQYLPTEWMMGEY